MKACQTVKKEVEMEGDQGIGMEEIRESGYQVGGYQVIRISGKNGFCPRLPDNPISFDPIS